MRGVGVDEAARERGRAGEPPGDRVHDIAAVHLATGLGRELGLRLDVVDARRRHGSRVEKQRRRAVAEGSQRASIAPLRVVSFSP